MSPSPIDGAPASGREPAPEPGKSLLTLILAGGLSRRMGGGDKGLRLLGGRAMLAHSIDRLVDQTPEGAASTLLNANGDPSRFDGFGLRVAPDTVADFPGPLAGVLAGMEAALEAGRAWVLSAAADTPFPPRDLARRLATSQAATDADIVLAATRDADGVLRDHPTFGLWRASLAPALRRALVEEGLRKVVIFTDRHVCRRVEFPSPDPETGLDPFFNINTPEELAVAEAALARMGGSA